MTVEPSDVVLTALRISAAEVPEAGEILVQFRYTNARVYEVFLNWLVAKVGDCRGVLTTPKEEGLGYLFIKTVFLLLLGFLATTKASPLPDAMAIPVKVVVVVMLAAIVHPDAPVGIEGGEGGVIEWAG